MDFKNKMNIWVGEVNKALDAFVPEKSSPEANIYRAMRYSLMAGGKRMRPVLSLAVCELLDGSMEEVMPYACAIEMIHTYSLIHDDLPAMDNDDYRRGRLTSHKVFGEGIAVLAGDALLNHAFETMINYTYSNPGGITAKLKAMSVIATASGANGMIGGQVVDLESEDREIQAEILRYMHRCKTGAMINASVLSAAILCKAEKKDIEALETYSNNIGLAFQIKDDILDIEGNPEKLGKNIGSDIDNKKTTFITLYGMEASKRMLAELTAEAIDAVEARFAEKAGFLKYLAEYLLKREN